MLILPPRPVPCVWRVCPRCEVHENTFFISVMYLPLHFTRDVCLCCASVAPSRWSSTPLPFLHLPTEGSCGLAHEFVALTDEADVLVHPQWHYYRLMWPWRRAAGHAAVTIAIKTRLCLVLAAAAGFKVTEALEMCCRP